MILIIDIGNSNIVGSVCVENDDPIGTEWKEVMRVKTVDKKTYSDCLLDINYSFNDYFDKIDKIVLSSVVPNLNAIYVQLCTEMFNIHPYIINYKVYNRLPIKIPQPRIIGSDIVANAVAGYNKYPNGCIVIDFGTVLTFTTVADKAVKGVSFVPGVSTAIDVLFEKAAQIPKIKIDPPKNVIGRNTCDAVNSGVFFGYGGLVDRMIDTIKHELGKDLHVMATGGIGKLMLPYCRTQLEYDVFHTVKGLKLVYEMTKQ